MVSNDLRSRMNLVGRHAPQLDASRPFGHPTFGRKADAAPVRAGIRPCRMATDFALCSNRAQHIDTQMKTFLSSKTRRRCAGNIALMLEMEGFR